MKTSIFTDYFWQQFHNRQTAECVWMVSGLDDIAIALSFEYSLTCVCRSSKPLTHSASTANISDSDVALREYACRWCSGRVPPAAPPSPPLAIALLPMRHSNNTYPKLRPQAPPVFVGEQLASFVKSDDSCAPNVNRPCDRTAVYCACQRACMSTAPSPAWPCALH
jgi:hypothetical protein